MYICLLIKFLRTLILHMHTSSLFSLSSSCIIQNWFHQTLIGSPNLNGFNNNTK